MAVNVWPEETRQLDWENLKKKYGLHPDEPMPGTGGTPIVPKGRKHKAGKKKGKAVTAAENDDYLIRAMKAGNEWGKTLHDYSRLQKVEEHHAKHKKLNKELFDADRERFAASRGGDDYLFHQQNRGKTIYPANEQEAFAQTISYGRGKPAAIPAPTAPTPEQLAQHKTNLENAIDKYGSRDGRQTAVAPYLAEKEYKESRGEAPDALAKSILNYNAKKRREDVVKQIGRAARAGRMDREAGGEGVEVPTIYGPPRTPEQREADLELKRARYASGRDRRAKDRRRVARGRAQQAAIRSMGPAARQALALQGMGYRPPMGKHASAMAIKEMELAGKLNEISARALVDAIDREDTQKFDAEQNKANNLAAMERARLAPDAQIKVAGISDKTAREKLEWQKVRDELDYSQAERKFLAEQDYRGARLSLEANIAQNESNLKGYALQLEQARDADQARKIRHDMGIAEQETAASRDRIRGMIHAQGTEQATKTYDRLKLEIQSLTGTDGKTARNPSDQAVVDAKIQMRDLYDEQLTFNAGPQWETVAPPGRTHSLRDKRAMRAQGIDPANVPVQGTPEYWQSQGAGPMPGDALRSRIYNPNADPGRVNQPLPSGEDPGRINRPLPAADTPLTSAISPVEREAAGAARGPAEVLARQEQLNAAREVAAARNQSQGDPLSDYMMGVDDAPPDVMGDMARALGYEDNDTNFYDLQTSTMPGNYSPEGTSEEDMPIWEVLAREAGQGPEPNEVIDPGPSFNAAEPQERLSPRERRVVGSELRKGGGKHSAGATRLDYLMSLPYRAFRGAQESLMGNQEYQSGRKIIPNLDPYTEAAYDKIGSVMGFDKDNDKERVLRDHLITMILSGGTLRPPTLSGGMDLEDIQRLR